jgi:hypothetical protein
MEKNKNLTKKIINYVEKGRFTKDILIKNLNKYIMWNIIEPAFARGYSYRNTIQRKINSESLKRNLEQCENFIKNERERFEERLGDFDINEEQKQKMIHGIWEPIERNIEKEMYIMMKHPDAYLNK